MKSQNFFSFAFFIIDIKNLYRIVNTCKFFNKRVCIVTPQRFQRGKADLSAERSMKFDEDVLLDRAEQSSI